MNKPRDIPIQSPARKRAEEILATIEDAKESAEQNRILIDAFGLNLREPLDGFNLAVLREFIALKITKPDDVGSPTAFHWVTRHCTEQTIEALLTRLLEIQNRSEEKKHDQQPLLDK